MKHTLPVSCQTVFILLLLAAEEVLAGFGRILPFVLGCGLIVAARDQLHTGVQDLQAVQLSELVHVPGRH